MELCSGDSPKSRRNMCKNTDQPIGIPVPLPSILPPIEKWYVVARKPSSGTCSIYSSWADYQAESNSPRSGSPHSLTSAEIKKNIIKDTEEKELAAFPLMAQALTYIKAIERESGSFSPPISSISSTLAKNRKSIKQNSHISEPQKRLYKRAEETIGDRSTDSDDERSASKAKSSPSPVPSESVSKKRKLENKLYLPILTRPMSMSKTSETIDIGSRTQDKRDMSSLDALAIAASATTKKKQEKAQQSHPPHITTVNSEDSSLASETSAVAVARCPPPPNIFPRGAIHATRSRENVFPSLSQQNEIIIGRRLQNRSLSPSLIADYNNARKSVEQQRQQQKLIQHHNEQQKEAQKRRERSLTSKVVIPEVPTTLTSSLKIPEVPRGFVPQKLRSERISRTISDHLKSSIDARANTIGPSLAKPVTYPLLGISNRFSLESYPLGQLPRQMQGLSQHLQGVPPTSVFQNSQQLLSLQLQSAKNLLIKSDQRSSSAYSQHLRQQQLQAIEVASSTSGASDCDHSEITLQRHNGLASRDSSTRG